MELKFSYILLRKRSEQKRFTTFDQVFLNASIYTAKAAKHLICREVSSGDLLFFPLTKTHKLTNISETGP
jgi:hypothetical protein